MRIDRLRSVLDTPKLSISLGMLSLQGLYTLKNMGCLIGWLKLAKGTTPSGIKKFFDLGTCPEFDIADKPLPKHDPLNPETTHGSTKPSGLLNQSNCFSLLSTDFA